MIDAAAAAAWLIGATVFGQNLPPELKKQQRIAVDPSLPEAVRGAVDRAAQAELDPKRGIGNAIEVLKAERRKHPGDKTAELALDLRSAAMVLRQRFLNNDKVSVPERYQQALSTFSKLDLTEPGMPAWLERTLELHPKAAQALDPEKGGRAIGAAVLVRGQGLDRDRVFERFARGMAQAGFRLVMKPPQEAEWLLKLASDEVREADRTLVRVVLSLERLQGQNVTWRTGLYRTSAAPKLEDAIASDVEWLVRIGGRDLLFQKLAESGLPFAVMTAPKTEDHHDHGSGHAEARPQAPAPSARVTLPKSTGTEPRPPPAPAHAPSKPRTP